MLVACQRRRGRKLFYRTNLQASSGRFKRGVLSQWGLWRVEALLPARCRLLLTLCGKWRAQVLYRR